MPPKTNLGKAKQSAANKQVDKEAALPKPERQYVLGRTDLLSEISDVRHALLQTPPDPTPPPSPLPSHQKEYAHAHTQVALRAVSEAVRRAAQEIQSVVVVDMIELLLHFLKSPAPSCATYTDFLASAVKAGETQQEWSRLYRPGHGDHYAGLMKQQFVRPSGALRLPYAVGLHWAVSYGHSMDL